MIHVVKIEETRSACPSQWEGRTCDGREVYARYRYGRLTVDVAGDNVFRAYPGDGLDGVMSYAELVEHTRRVIAWPPACCA